MCNKYISNYDIKTIFYLKLIFLFFFIFGNSLSLISQNKAVSNSLKKKKEKVNWTKYYTSSKVKVLYSYQEDEPVHGYKGEYIIFKVINNSKETKTVSWDFSAIDQDGNCFNCDNNNVEVHFEKQIQSKHNIYGNPNNIVKGPLTMFNRFTDSEYKGNATIGWKTFTLNNITIK